MVGLVKVDFDFFFVYSTFFYKFSGQFKAFLSL